MIEQEPQGERRRWDRRESNTVPKVPCPACGKWISSVKDGRAHRDGYQRKRVCKDCGKIFFTIERAA